MNKGFLAALLPATLTTICLAQSPLDDLKKTAEAAFGSPRNGAEGLSDDRITAGLKEALRVSTGKAVASTGRPDGFLKNAAIKILLPPKLQTAGRTMRAFGMRREVDDLEIGMNRAAEQATPQAKEIFLRTLTRMTFTDAHGILSGGNTAATEYFKRASTQELTEAFTPIVHQGHGAGGRGPAVQPGDAGSIRFPIRSQPEHEFRQLRGRQDSGRSVLRPGTGRIQDSQRPGGADDGLVEGSVWGEVAAASWLLAFGF